MHSTNHQRIKALSPEEFLRSVPIILQEDTSLLIAILCGLEEPNTWFDFPFGAIGRKSLDQDTIVSILKRLQSANLLEMKIYHSTLDVATDRMFKANGWLTDQETISNPYIVEYRELAAIQTTPLLHEINRHFLDNTKKATVENHSLVRVYKKEDYLLLEHEGYAPLEFKGNLSIKLIRYFFHHAQREYWNSYKDIEKSIGKYSNKEIREAIDRINKRVEKKLDIENIIKGRKIGHSSRSSKEYRWYS